MNLPESFPVIGVLRGPLSPAGLPAIHMLAQQCHARGLTLFYMSYRRADIGADGCVEGYVFSEGQWQPARLPLPRIIDNAPPDGKGFLSIHKTLNRRTFLLYRIMGGKRRIMPIIRESGWFDGLMIPDFAATPASVREAMTQFGRVVLKPDRANRGRGVFSVERAVDGYRVADDQRERVLDEDGLSAWVASLATQGYVGQRFISSRDGQGRPFDIRVPVFRGDGGQWRCGPPYVRCGRGRLTSNLSTGGQASNAEPFLAAIVGEARAAALVAQMRDAALRMADLLQDAYGFLIPSLGVDFGVADGQASLFEVNEYPGILGCRAFALQAKAGLYEFLQQTLPASPEDAVNGEQNLLRVFEASRRAERRPGRLAPWLGGDALNGAAEASDRLSWPAQLRREAASQGVDFRVVEQDHIHLTDRATGVQATLSPSSLDNSVYLKALTADMMATRALLAAQDLPVVRHRVFRHLGSALAYLRQSHHPQRVRPAGRQGRSAYTANVCEERTLRHAWDVAQRLSPRVVLEDDATGCLLRLYVLERKVVAAVCVMPAWVVGDGQRSLRELIDEKNQQRQQQRFLRRYPIRTWDYATDVMGMTLDERPASGEMVRLSSVADIAAGGELAGVLARVHPAVARLAVRAAAALGTQELLAVDIQAAAPDAAVDGSTAIVQVQTNPPLNNVCHPQYGEAHPDLAALTVQAFKRQVSRAQPNGADDARHAPAATYVSSCGGDSFARDYSVQRQLLRQAAYARNLTVQELGGKLTVLRHGARAIGFFHGMSSQTQEIARVASNRKAWTKRLLDDAGVATPQGQVFDRRQKEAAWSYIEQDGQPFVIKPSVGSGGIGVSTNIRTRSHFDLAWTAALATGAITVICEPYYEGNDYRVVVVGDALAAVTRRVPAHLVGDGVQTVSALLAQKNASRRDNPYTGAKPAKLTPMILRNLAQLGLAADSVLAAGQYLQLHTVANIGSGGESEDVTDQVHPDWIPIAARVRQAVYQPAHVGFDLIAQDVALPPSAQSWTIIEVNTNPDFGLQHFPTRGEPRDVAGALLAHLFPSARGAAPVIRQVRFLGKVQGVGLRRWVWRRAHMHGLAGWIANGEAGQVDAVFRGQPKALQQLLDRAAQRFGAQCESAPWRARAGEDVPATFEIR